MEVARATLNTGQHHSNVTSGLQLQHHAYSDMVDGGCPLPLGCSCRLFCHSTKNTKGHERPEQGMVVISLQWLCK